MVNPNIFREYDIRGIVDQDLSPEIVRTLGRGMGTYFRGARAGGRSPRAGLPAELAGILPPSRRRIDVHGLPSSSTWGRSRPRCSISRSSTRDFEAGRHDHRLAQPARIQRLQDDVGAGDPLRRFHPGRPPHHRERGILRRPRRAGDPLRHRPGIPRLRGQERSSSPGRCKLVLDAGNGTGGVVAVPIFKRLGCEVVELFCDMDGRFPNHHPDPTLPEAMETPGQDGPRDRSGRRASPTTGTPTGSASSTTRGISSGATSS